ncbi:TetR/AcrR family transcriptional regulator [Uliginosibacterium sp. sgz301328]|uniref:TetR/AcrR family transcriptional regulator n=1 Tax=Uliginosibacterium sp. sgz301328 TaxID=3243764 RepID=UPI00359D99B3
METRSENTRHTLDRSAWVQLATELLAEDGLAGVRVEVLAKQLGVTKGSFYWHFKDRQALLEAVLETWREGRVRDSARQAEATPATAREQIRRVIDAYSIRPNRKGVRIELAIRDWARRDAQAAAAVEDVDRARLDDATALFRLGGFSENDARMRALLLYTHSFGLSMMVYTRMADDIGQLHQQVTRLISGEETR